MTNDNFTEAARAEAGRRWPAYPTVGFSGAGDRQVPFIEGACWARTHLAAQEPTDAEVGAFQMCLYDRTLTWVPTVEARVALRAAYNMRWQA